MSYLSLTGCGYKVAGKADLLPKNLHTIAIPAFNNVTTAYKLTDRLPNALAREFIARTRYQVVADPREADMILTGAVAMVFAYPTTFDPLTARAAGAQVQVVLQVTLRERVSGKILYTQPALDYRERYEISTDPQAYFDESSPAFERMSHGVARNVVSAILEMF
ncbi:MAG: hypothetical protein K2X03_26195 [Bryobacteraceae bacterium]|nr:hypothetical protein [Bryobacteraceae bacterium]